MKIKLYRGDRGGATVEFAVIAVLLLTVVFGIIEFGIIMFDQHILTNASREGARAGIVMRIPRLSDEEIKDIVKNYAAGHMVSVGASSNPDFGPWPGEDPEVWILPVEADRAGDLFGIELQVTVKYQYDFLVLSILGLEPITLKADTRMLME